jgi:hypothetical protein
MGRQGLSRLSSPLAHDGWLRGSFPADLAINRVDKQLRDLLLVRSDRPKVRQRLSQRRVFIEHTRAVMALPTALVRFHRTEEPRHPASVRTRSEATKCRRSRLDTRTPAASRAYSMPELSRML